jgi:peroxiredoxin Q/BCP
MSTSSKPGAAVAEELPARVRVGDTAPGFTLQCADGSAVTLSGLRGRAVVLFFYTQDDSTSCTKQCQLFDSLRAEFAARGTLVYGISSDSLNSHVKFAEKYGLHVPLLADTGGRVRALYGNPAPHHRLVPRITFVIDRDGIVRHVTYFLGMGKVQPHIDEALYWARQLAGDGPDRAEPGGRSR